MKSMTQRMLTKAVVVCVGVLAGAADGQEFKTVIGPSNVDLADGANLLRAGEAEEGLARTLEGLKHAGSRRERIAGNSNACAAYIMLDNPNAALPYCNKALEINDRHWRALTNRALVYLELGRFEESEVDLLLAEEIAPSARSVKFVRQMFLDATDPVAPHVIVDDRRQVPESDED